MIPTIRLECANCGYTTDLPENPSVKRVQGMALAFYKEHGTARNAQNRGIYPPKSDCRLDHVFIRTFKV